MTVLTVFRSVSQLRKTWGRAERVVGVGVVSVQATVHWTNIIRTKGTRELMKRGLH